MHTPFGSHTALPALQPTQHQLPLTPSPLSATGRLRQLHCDEPWSPCTQHNTNHPARHSCLLLTASGEFSAMEQDPTTPSCVSSATRQAYRRLRLQLRRAALHNKACAYAFECSRGLTRQARHGSASDAATMQPAALALQAALRRPAGRRHSIGMLCSGINLLFAC